jgi:hypothetical protein
LASEPKIQPILTDLSSLGIGTGAAVRETVCVYWANVTNPEKWIVPWDCYLVYVNITSFSINRIFSRDGRTSVPASGMAGAGGGLIAMVAGATSWPWIGRAKLKMGDELWYGGSSTSMISILTFELVKEGF